MSSIHNVSEHQERKGPKEKGGLRDRQVQFLADRLAGISAVMYDFRLVLEEDGADEKLCRAIRNLMDAALRPDPDNFLGVWRELPQYQTCLNEIRETLRRSV